MIGILTFHWADDYGAMLQAYALKRYLEKTTKEQVKIIPYAPVKFIGRYWLLPVIAIQKDGKFRYHIASYRLKRNFSIFLDFLKRRKSMRAFRRHYLTGEPALRKNDKISLSKFSSVFVGSDQVWNPEITIGLDDVYTGNIKSKGECRFIAYGASFGGGKIADRYLPQFSKSINRNFKAISLREKSAVSFVKKYFCRSVENVLDPTLLLNQNEWKKLGKPPKEMDYILFVYTEYNKQMIQFLHYLSEELQKKVIQLSMPWPGEKEDWIDIKVTGGPSEFIGYIQNAAYIVTNSFHGMVFSVLFEKYFLVFSHSNKNARIEDFLKKLCLDTRLIEDGKAVTKEMIMAPIDWKDKKQILEKEKERSIKYIQENYEGNIE